MQYRVPRFTSFHPLTESEVHTVIMRMKNKHCKLDTIPMSILKQILEACLPAITQIVNMSLTNGEFYKNQNIAVVKPLFKNRSIGPELKTAKTGPIHLSSLVENCFCGLIY